MKSGWERGQGWKQVGNWVAIPAGAGVVVACLGLVEMERSERRLGQNLSQGGLQLEVEPRCPDCPFGLFKLNAL